MDMGGVARVYNLANNFAAFNIVWAYIKIFKYLQVRGEPPKWSAG